MWRVLLSVSLLVIVLSPETCRAAASQLIPAGSELMVNTHTTDSQRSSAVAIDDLGNFVVVWHSDNQDGDQSGIFGQRFAPDGSKLGSEFQVNSTTSGSQFDRHQRGRRVYGRLA